LLQALLFAVQRPCCLSKTFTREEFECQAVIYVHAIFWGNENATGARISGGFIRSQTATV
jgi:hypothetical protein